MIALERGVQMYVGNRQVLNKCKYILGNIFWSHGKRLQKEYFDSKLL